MTTTAVKSQLVFGVWNPEDVPFAVEYSIQVMEELRLLGEQGFQKIPHGGIEVGAVLLGTREPDLVRILEWRPIECDHSRGPGFVLSGSDLSRLRDLLTSLPGQPVLADLEVVGWFHTHTRSAVALTDADLQIHQQYFPEPHQVALVMKPAKDQPTMAGFFCRTADGVLSGQSVREFIVHPQPSALLGPKRATAAPIGGGYEAEPTPADARPPRPESRSVRHSRPPERPVRNGGELLLPPLPATLNPAPLPALYRAKDAREQFRWRVMVAAVVFLAAFTAFAVTAVFWPRPVRPALTLQIEEVSDQAIVRWDQSSKPVKNADRGLIRVVDGIQAREISLTAEEVKAGSVTYVRASADVKIYLILYRRGEEIAREFTQILAAPVKAPPQQAAASDLSAMRREERKLAETLRVEQSRGRDLRQSLRKMESEDR